MTAAAPARPLMPKATAAWLLENSTLTFPQIAEFCGLHELEIQALADGEGGYAVRPIDPIASHQLTEDEIRRCEKDENTSLKMLQSALPKPKTRTKGPRYTPLTKRGEKPDAIAWLVKMHPELSDQQISKLIGTTKTTITNIRSKSHWNMANITPNNPVELGLCTLKELETALQKATKNKPGTSEPLEQEPSAYLEAELE